jgi:asparagine synthase (glutamine-hydrolysing)
MRHLPCYVSSQPLATKCADVRFTAYPEYPLLHVRGERFSIFLEGVIYNKSVSRIQSELEAVFTSFRDDEARLRGAIGNWILGNDGEYVAVVHDRQFETVALLTDALGRLPLFYSNSGSELLIAREPKFITRCTLNRKPDRVGIAEFLVHGYNVGDRTMSDGIKRLPPASLVCHDSLRNSITNSVMYDWNLERLTADAPFEDCVQSAAATFCDVTASRVQRPNSGAIALSLSGGLDSRAVGAALRKEGFAFSAHTCVSHDRANIKEAMIAERVAKALGCPWSSIQLSEPRAEMMVELIRRQEGGSATWMATELEHYQLLRRISGDHATLFTGDGGNNVMYSLLPPSEVRSVADIMAQTFDAVYHWDLRTASQLLRVSPDEVRQAYQDSIDHFPEQTPEGKFRHHKFLGRPFRFVMEGEDRTRFEFWVGAPFWALPFVMTMLNAPESFKSNFRLYRAIIDRINPEMSRITYAATLVNIPLAWLPVYSRINSFIKSHPGLYRSLRAVLLSSRTPRFSIPSLEQRFKSMLTRSPILEECFNVQLLRKSFERGLSWSRYNLLSTALLRIEQIETG